MIPKNLEELAQLYKDSESVDKELYSEMRSNVLLIAGEHYTKNVNKHFARLRETNRLTETLKLRLTKNHMHRIHRTYRNAILDKVPGVKAFPANEAEMQDQKDAELDNKVWDHLKAKHKMKDKVRKWADEYCGIGEVWTKIFWDASKGDHVGYHQKLDDFGEPMFDEAGEPVPGKPVFSGALVYEPIFGFNLFRSPGAKCMDDSPYIGFRKMVRKEHLKALYMNEDGSENKAIKNNLTKSSEIDYVVFESGKARYEKKENWVLIKEVYYRPSIEHPEGYYFIWSEFGILAQGKLPYGIFPIAGRGFDEYPTNPRGRSILKVARPYQAELNRSASQQATHQITLGDDKILYQAGTKLTPGALLPGVRGIAFQGQAPQILAGRTGDQFTDYTQSEKNDMYEAVMLDEISQKDVNNVDAYSLLFRSMSQQARFKNYIEKFEDFMVDVHDISIELTRKYQSQEELAEIVGKDNMMNLQEFLRPGPRRHHVRADGMSDDISTTMGKQITFQHLLQYVGKQMKPEDVGKIMRQMPFVNNEEIFNDMTINYDNVRNDMLALERGEQPVVTQYMDSEYYVEKLQHRMKQPDFRYLPPQVQQGYAALMQQHQQVIVQKQQAIIDAKNEYIPTDGAMITLSMQMPAPDGEGTKQVRLPYSAIMHLINQLQKQGQSLETLENMNQGVLAEMSGQMMSQPIQSGPQQR